MEFHNSVGNYEYEFLSQCICGNEFIKTYVAFLLFFLRFAFLFFILKIFGFQRNQVYFRIS